MPPRWVFKGGTCLRKAYYHDYRFSEDLDFTVVGPLSSASVMDRVRRAARVCTERGVDLVIEELRVKIADDDYGRESIEVLVPYRGSLRRRGVPRNARFHFSADEVVLLDTERRELIHPYPDSVELECELECYSPEEMLAEKLRAVGGQRRFAISRDLYDIGQLVDRGADVERSLAILPRKTVRKGVDLQVALARFAERREEYRADWERSLAYLVQDGADFDAAFTATARLLSRMEIE